MATNTSYAPAEDAGMRKRSVGGIEMNTADGRRATVDLNDLSLADRELAEKFGYKPVSARYNKGIRGVQADDIPGIQARIWLPLNLFLRRLHFRTLRYGDHHLFHASLWRRGRLSSMVLAYLWSRLYVHCVLCRRACLSLSHMRRSVLHNLSSRSPGMGTLHQLV